MAHRDYFCNESNQLFVGFGSGRRFRGLVFLVSAKITMLLVAKSFLFRGRKLGSKVRVNSSSCTVLFFSYRSHGWSAAFDWPRKQNSLATKKEVNGCGIVHVPNEISHKSSYTLKPAPYRLHHTTSQLAGLDPPIDHLLPYPTQAPALLRGLHGTVRRLSSGHSRGSSKGVELPHACYFQDPRTTAPNQSSASRRRLIQLGRCSASACGPR